MPDPQRDHTPYSRPRAAAPPPLSYDEEKRLRALETPWPGKLFAYLDWLCHAMPEPAATALFFVLVFGGIIGGLALLLGIGWTVFIIVVSPWSGLLWFVLGVVWGVIGAWLLRAAAATEMRYRQSTADKISRQKENVA